MNLKHGYITSNGYWISYKTNSYYTGLGYLKELAEELHNELKSQGFETNIDDYEFHKATLSDNRLGCVTIMCFIKIPGNLYRYEDSEIN